MQTLLIAAFCFAVGFGLGGVTSNVGAILIAIGANALSQLVEQINTTRSREWIRTRLSHLRFEHLRNALEWMDELVPAVDRSKVMLRIVTGLLYLLASGIGLLVAPSQSSDGSFQLVTEIDGDLAPAESAPDQGFVVRPLAGIPVGGSATSVAFSESPFYLAVGTTTGVVERWDYEALLPVGNLGVQDPDPGANPTVFDVAISPDNLKVATANGDGTVRFFDNERSETATLNVAAHTTATSGVDFSPDGLFVASAGIGGGVRILGSINGESFGTIEPSTGSPADAVFSPDGSLIAVAGGDGSVQIWDTATGDQALMLLGHTAAVSAVAFNPSGTVVASGSLDATIRLWDVATGEQLGAALQVHTDAVTSVGFSPDGALLTSGGLDGVVRLWDWAAAESDVLIPDTPSEVLDVGFSPSGDVLVSATRDGNVWLWQPTLATCEQIAESVSTPLERDRIGYRESLDLDGDGIACEAS